MFLNKAIPPKLSFPYAVRRSQRARHLKIEISLNKGVVLVVPRFASLSLAYRFLLEKSSWVEAALMQQEKIPKSPFPQLSLQEMRRTKKELRENLFSRLEHFAPLLKVGWKKVTIRNQRTRWGSCSRGGVLSFNYRLAFLPSELMDYIIVHELSHLKELNHSPRFWRLVETILPDYKVRKKKLREFGPLS